jgi:ABC-type transport system involved in multi-copper enzyme maturation permease subunit
MPASVPVVLVCSLAALLVWAVRRRTGPLVGPLFFYDVVRLARRRRGTALRFVYGLALLLALAIVYDRCFPGHSLLSFSGAGPTVSLSGQARFAQSFAIALLLLQNVAVLVLTPAYLAGAVAEEKEKKTLTLLLTTRLTDREIVLGKMLGRLTHIGGVLLVGLPVLSLAQLWGGVDVYLLLVGFAVTLLTLLSVGAVCLFCSALANTVLPAVIGAYVFTALLGFGCLCQGGGFAFSPISFVVELDGRMTHAEGDPQGVALEMLGYYALVHGLAAICGVVAAVSQLRPSDEASLGLRLPDPLPAAGRPPTRRPDPTELAEMLGLYRPSPPVGDDALFWKEVFQGTGPLAPKLRHELMVSAAAWLAVTVTIWAAVGALLWLPNQRDRYLVWHGAMYGLNVVLRVGTLILLTVICTAAGFRAAGCVTRERDRRTLDGLLALPLARAAILRAKWLGCVLRMRYVGYCVVLLWLVGVTTGGLHPLALPLLALTAAAHVAFVVSAGVWVSVAARGTVWANFTMAVLLVLFFAVGWLVWLWAGTPSADDLDFVGNLVLTGLNPWRAWWTLAVPLARPWWAEQFEPERVALLTSALGGVFFAALAAWAWLLAVRRFQGEQGRGA